MDELEFLVQRVQLKRKPFHYEETLSLWAMNPVTYFKWMWGVERKGKIVEECKNKVALPCKPQLTVKLDNNFDQF